jgi:hypothetical protein
MESLLLKFRKYTCLPASKRDPNEMPLTMERTIRVDTGRIRAEVGNYGFNAPAEVVDVRFVRAKVDHPPVGTVRGHGKIDHHPWPE